MYTVEFHDNAKNKKLNLTSNIKETCHNIKSLTIDYEDIEHIRYCDFSKKDDLVVVLGGFVSRTQRLNKKSLSKYITIVNDSDLNEMFIYALLNRDWILSSEDTNYDTLLLKSRDELNKLYEKIEVEQDSKELLKLKNRVILIEYFIKQINEQPVEEINRSNSLVLCTRASY